MQAMEEVFAQQDADTMHRKEAILEKKLVKGDGGWNQHKEVLGWILDSERMTLELTEQRAKRIIDIFEDLQGRNRVSVKKWQCVLGELQFMGPAVPGSAGLFGALQLGLAHSDKHRVKITRFLQDHLTDFEALARDISLHPTQLAEVVLDYPSVIGSVDAAKPGMGGVLFTPGHPPTLWRASFLPDVQARIITYDNLGGDLTNSDLEQAGILAHADVAVSLYDLWELTLSTLNDNTAAISRNRKGAITSNQPVAYLCRLSSLHCRHHHYCHEVSHIQGLANEMANILSCHHDLSDSQILTLLTLVFHRTNLGACSRCRPKCIWLCTALCSRDSPPQHHGCDPHWAHLPL